MKYVRKGTVTVKRSIIDRGVLSSRRCPRSERLRQRLPPQGHWPTQPFGQHVSRAARFVRTLRADASTAGRVRNAPSPLRRYYVPGTHWQELPIRPQLQTGVNPGLQLFDETEQPMPSTLEHWQVPEPLPPPPPVPVPPPPEVPPQGHPQLQVTSDPEETTSATASGNTKRPVRNRPGPKDAASAVKPGIRTFMFIAISFRDALHKSRGVTRRLRAAWPPGSSEEVEEADAITVRVSYAWRPGTRKSVWRSKKLGSDRPAS